MPAPQVIIELAATFKRNLIEYKKNLNETETRVRFINRFFEALDWDIQNKDSESGFEVLHEGKLDKPMTDAEGRHLRAPDYIFKHGPMYSFVVEAKRPSVSIEHDAKSAFQVRSYGWSAKVPLAILTDFEEFAVYDTRFAPVDGDSVNMARRSLYKYEDYEQVWDKIAALFSRGAVANGSLDAFVQLKKPERPTIPVDAAFLTEIEKWRHDLAINIANLPINSQLDVRQLNRLVQMTIDRLIFLRFCEDRGIEDDNRLLRLTEGGDSIYPQLVKLFQQADDRYNSGLFHFKKEPDRDQPDEADLQPRIGDAPLREIITRLSRGPYAFGVIPVEIIGQVYEQFLGKVITLSSSHSAEVEDKPEVRKAGGVYYTPQYIVDYIVRNTVGKLVKGKQPKQIANLKILDPACGSGSFLVGAYSFLLQWYRRWYVEHGPEKYKDELYELGIGLWRLTTKAKKDILLHHIYGVDIDTQAVEVTKLSLMLKMLEDDDRQTLQYRLFTTDRVLPNLDDNIKCGNSLIGKDFFTGQTPTAEERRRVNAFDWSAAFPAIVTYNDKSEMVGGFDAVIGNPPYIRIQTMMDEPQGKAMLDYYKLNYAAGAKGNYDIYVLFVEQGLQMLGKAGRLGYILPHKFFNAKYGEPLRGLLANGKHLAEVIHYGDQQVFANATTYTALMFLDKAGRDELQFTKVADLKAWRNSGVADSGIIPASNVTAAEWNFSIGEGSALFDRLSKMSVKLKDVSSAMFVGQQTSADTVYLFKQFRADEGGTTVVFSQELADWLKIESAILRSVIRSGSIHRYEAVPTAVILFPYKVVSNNAHLYSPEEMRNSYPLAWDYLKKNRALLEGREGGRFQDEQWYRFGRNQNIGMWEQPKLMIPYMITQLSAYIDKTDDYYFINVTTGGYGITIKPLASSLEYLCGLLNSHLLDFYLKQVSTNFHGGYFAANKQFIEQLPIRVLDLSNPTEKEQHDRMVQLVQQMLELKRQEAAGTLDGPTRETMRDIDWEIDQLVYKLYGLTAEEIKIVEAATKLAATIPLSAPRCSSGHKTGRDKSAPLQTRR